MKALTILRHTEKAMADPDRWCRGSFYRRKGHRVERCASGWINHYSRTDTPRELDAIRALSAAIWSLHGGDLTIREVNDGPDGRERILRALVQAQADLQDGDPAASGKGKA